MDMMYIKKINDKYILNFLIPFFILLSVIYLMVKNLATFGGFNQILIVSAVLVILLLFISVFSFERGLLVLIFLTCVINSVPVIIMKQNLLYPLILFAFLGFVLGGRFRASETEAKLFEEDNKFKILNFFIFLFSITITISVVFTALNNFNFFNPGEQGICIYNINVIGSTSLSALIFSLEMYLNYIMTFILLFLMVRKLEMTRRFLLRLFYTLFIANLVVFFVFIYQVFFDKGFGNQPHWIGTEQLNSTMLGPNSYGFFLFLNIGIFTAFLFYLDKKHKILCLPVLLILPVQIIYSGSRTSLMGLVIFAVPVISYLLFPALVNLIKKRKVSKNDVQVAVTVLILIIIVPLIFSLVMLKTGMDWDSDIVKPSMLLRLGKNIEQLDSDDPLLGITSGRTIIWPQAVNIIRDYPLVGIGIGTFPLELPNYLKLAGSDLRIVDYTLNTYLQILAENGIFSFLFFVGLYVTLFLIIFNNLKKIAAAKNKKFMVIFIFIIFTCLVMFIFASGTNSYEGQIIYSLILILSLLLSYDLKNTAYAKK
jgi:O-antigen ligase